MIVLFSASMETQCNSCGKVISKKNLAVHLKTHGDASIRCKICDKRFKTKKQSKSACVESSKTTRYKLPQLSNISSFQDCPEIVPKNVSTKKSNQKNA